MTHASLCTGIGGFDLAASWMGWENVFQCEINPFCHRVLKYWFPQCELFSDIKTSDFKKYANTIDIISAGFPCQPFSVAGKRKGTSDDRHIWPEVYRAICDVRPQWFVGENVPEILTIERGVVFKGIKSDLENAGYQVFKPVEIPACAVDKDHLRYRVFFIANATSDVLQTRFKDEKKRRAKTNRTKSRHFWKTWEELLSVAVFTGDNDGISERLDGITFSSWRRKSIEAYGNAVVPQVVYQIFKAIEKGEQFNNQWHD